VVKQERQRARRGRSKTQAPHDRCKERARAWPQQRSSAAAQRRATAPAGQRAGQQLAVRLCLVEHDHHVVRLLASVHRGAWPADLAGASGVAA